MGDVNTGFAVPKDTVTNREVWELPGAIVCAVDGRLTIADPEECDNYAPIQSRSRGSSSTPKPAEDLLIIRGAQKSWVSGREWFPSVSGSCLLIVKGSQYSFWNPVTYVRHAHADACERQTMKYLNPNVYQLSPEMTQLYDSAKAYLSQ